MPNAPVIVALGEVLWDCFPDERRFGGAPANFACTFAGLAVSSAQVFMVSAVGRNEIDELGHKAKLELQQRGVICRNVVQNEYPTGQVIVQFNEQGQPNYDIRSPAAWDHLNWTSDLEQLARSASVACLGTLGQRHPESQTTIQRFIKSTPRDCLRVLDVNLRTPHWTESTLIESFQLADVVKLNEDELQVTAQLLGLTGTDEQQLRSLRINFNWMLVALTRGERGSLLMTDREISIHPGHSVPIVDTVGAGDAFTAAMTLGWLNKFSLEEINHRASTIAAFVCTQPGGAPQIPDSYRIPKN